MKYSIGYIITEMKINENEQLEPVSISDFIPLKPALIFDEKEQAVSKVEKLKLDEVLRAMLNNSFKSEGDKINNYCYNEIE